MRLPYLSHPLYRFARVTVPEKIKPMLRGWYNACNKFFTYGQTDIFTALDIETNSRCNLKCTYCPVARYDRGNNYMSEELFKKIIDDVAAFPVVYKGRVSPHFYGDPLVDDRLADLMRYTRERLPKAVIIIHTNGVALTRATYRALVNAGIDGLLITKHLKFWPKGVQEVLQHEPDAKKYIMRQRLDNVGIFERGGTVPVHKAHQFKRCYYVSDEIAIDYRGKVICTNDFFVRDSFGDVRTRSLGDIWWDPKFVEIRRQLRSGDIVLKHCREVCGIDTADFSNIPTDADATNIYSWKTKNPV